MNGTCVGFIQPFLKIRQTDNAVQISGENFSLFAALNSLGRKQEVDKNLTKNGNDFLLL